MQTLFSDYIQTSLKCMLMYMPLRPLFILIFIQTLDTRDILGVSMLPVTTLFCWQMANSCSWWHRWVLTTSCVHKGI